MFFGKYLEIVLETGSNILTLSPAPSLEIVKFIVTLPLIVTLSYSNSQLVRSI